MSLTIKSTTIDGLAIRVQPLPAVQSAMLWARVMQAASSATGANVTAAGLVLANPELVEAARLAFMPVSFVNGKGLHSDVEFNAHFTGRPKAIFEWLAFCLTSEYEGFLVGAASDQDVVAVADQDILTT